jgi:hypothetical protein
MSYVRDTHQIWEANVQPLGPMFQHLLVTWGPNNKPKMLKVGPKLFFWGPWDSWCKVGLKHEFKDNFTMSTLCITTHETTSHIN